MSALAIDSTASLLPMSAEEQAAADWLNARLPRLRGPFAERAWGLGLHWMGAKRLAVRGEQLCTVHFLQTPRAFLRVAVPLRGEPVVLQVRLDPLSDPAPSPEDTTP